MLESLLIEFCKDINQVYRCCPIITFFAGAYIILAILIAIAIWYYCRPIRPVSLDSGLELGSPRPIDLNAYYADLSPIYEEITPVSPYFISTSTSSAC
jgi:hypothetical protein